MTNDPLLTPQQVADELGLEYRTVLRKIRAGEIACLNLGHRTKRVRRSALNEYLRNHGDETACS